MIEDYLTVADRIRQELDDLARVVARAERAIKAAGRQSEDQDLYLDSVALNLHDFYAGLERIFHQIATMIDGNLPTGREWHRDLLQQMQADLPDLRPPVLSIEARQAVDEFLRFRHVVRHIYAFQFDPNSLERLVQLMPSAFQQAKAELLAFAEFLEQVGRDT